MFKRLMRSSAGQNILGWLVAQYMRLIKGTTKWEVRRSENIDPIIASGESFIALTWHSRFMMLTSAWDDDYQHPSVMISRSRDGAVVAATCKFLGLSTLRGSARKPGSEAAKGGAEAFNDGIEALEKGGCVVITPDGPRGPRQRIKFGALRLARATGAPLISCTFSVKKCKKINSWDRFILPKLFGRGVIIWGTPTHVPKDTSDAELDIIRQRLEVEMNNLLAQADTDLGHDAVEPA